MEYLMEEDDEAYKRQFATYIADGIEPDQMEDLYKAAHANIRKDPKIVKTAKKVLTVADKEKLKAFKSRRTNYKQRKNRIDQKIKAFHREVDE
jgi:large subunit ribosomal protein L5e